MTSLLDKTWTRCQERSLSQSLDCYNLRLIEQQLWFCRRGGITVYDANLEEQRHMHIVHCVYDVTQTAAGHIVIASSNGLYHISNTGTCNPYSDFIMTYQVQSDIFVNGLKLISSHICTEVFLIPFDIIIALQNFLYYFRIIYFLNVKT